MASEIKPELIAEVRTLITRGTKPGVIKKLISRKTGFKKTKTNQIYNDIVNQSVLEDIVPVLEEDNQNVEFWSENIETLEKPYFNSDSKQYIVFLNCIGRNIVVNEDKHRSILQMYSNWDGDERTIGQICRNVQWPRPVLLEYLKKFNITHDSLPVTDEDLSGKSDKELLGTLRELRKFSLNQKFEKESWDAIRADAAKWRAYAYKQYDPFVEFLNNYKPKPITPLPTKKQSGHGGYNPKDLGHTLLIGLNDIHWGQHTNSRYIYNKKINGGNWSIDKTNEAMDDYFSQIANDINDRKYNFNEAVVCALGDLLHTWNGFTEKGTKIEGFPLGQEQFDQALDSLIRFFTRLLELIPKVKVYSVSGNHSLLDTLLIKAVSIYFRLDKRITFDIRDTRYIDFKIHNTLFIAEHGASALYKSKVPKGGSPLQAYIDQLFLKRSDALVGVKNKVFLMGDIHTFKAEEIGDVERYVFGTLVGNDQYADHCNWNNRPRQNCLVVNSNGVKEILNYYLKHD